MGRFQLTLGSWWCSEDICTFENQSAGSAWIRFDFGLMEAKEVRRLQIESVASTHKCGLVKFVFWLNVAKQACLGQRGNL